MNNAHDRDVTRRLLRMWGGTTRYCAMRHTELAELQELIRSTVGLHPVATDGQPRGAGHGDPTARQAELLAQLKERYQSRIEYLLDDIDARMSKAHSVEEAMCDLDPVERLVIKYRYEAGKSYQSIGQVLHYTEVGAKKIEARAVDKISLHISMTIL